MSTTVFDTRPIVFADWTLVAFAIGALAGMLIRRIVPAMATTLAVYTGLAIVTWAFLQTNSMPVSRFWPLQFIEGGCLLALRAAHRRDRLAGPPPRSLKGPRPEK